MNHLLARGICIQNGYLLLAFHKEKKYYFLPGGHIEEGEAAMKALQREIDEETNVTTGDEMFISVLEHAYDVGAETHHEITLLFSYTVSSLSVSSSVPHLDFEWVPLSNLNEINFLPKILAKHITCLPSGPFPPFLSSFSHSDY